MHFLRTIPLLVISFAGEVTPATQRTSSVGRLLGVECQEVVVIEG